MTKPPLSTLLFESFFLKHHQCQVVPTIVSVSVVEIRCDAKDGQLNKASAVSHPGVDFILLGSNDQAGWNADLEE
jgi:hypothetical protein